MHRSTRLAEKRGLDPTELDGQPPEPKRPKVPALASVIVEALKVDSLQKLCSSLEPILRRVVSEEVERALAKLGPARIAGRQSPKRIEAPQGTRLQLHFRTPLSLPLFTGGKVEGEQGAAIHVVLLDADTGHMVTSGPEASAKLDVVVLEGDFNNEDDDDWTEEEFETHVVKEREGKRPLLTGELQVTLKEGLGTLGDLTFTDNSSWIRSRKFRLGLRVASGFCEGIRIREAKTESFIVKDHRGELYKKHYPPALTDEVWRLEKIGKDGAFHKKLNQSRIHTVEDFLRLVVRDPQKLRSILGSGMSNKMWESLVEHAKTCVMSGKLYVYYHDDTRSIGAVFNNIYEFTGLISNDQYYADKSLTDSQKVVADALVKKAYDNWMNVVEYDGKALLKSKQKKKAVLPAPDNMPTTASPNYLYDQQTSVPCLQTSVPCLQTSFPSQGGSMDPSLAVGGVISTGYDSQLARYSNPQNSVPSAAYHMESTSYTHQNQYMDPTQIPPVTRNNSTGLALGPPQPTNLEFQPLVPSMQTQNVYDDWHRQRDGHGVEDLLSEEEIRLRSHEMLENEDMQQLLRMLGMGGASNALAEDGYSLPSYMPTPLPNYNFDEDRSSTRSGKAVVGWLKIKAAMRWGIFIRKKAARRRAQLVELEG